MARRHDVWHYALWSLIQQSEILFAQGFLQAARENREKAFQLIREQHLEQLPMHEFLLRIRAQLLWAWSRLDEAESCARRGLNVLSSFQPQQQLQCLALLVQCSLARGDRIMPVTTLTARKICSATDSTIATGSPTPIRSG